MILAFCFSSFAPLLIFLDRRELSAWLRLPSLLFLFILVERGLCQAATAYDRDKRLIKGCDGGFGEVGGFFLRIKQFFGVIGY